MRILILIVTLLLMQGCGMNKNESKAETPLSNKELIILATPPSGDEYYMDVMEGIFDFHIRYAKTILEQDDVIILASPDYYDDYVNLKDESSEIKYQQVTDLIK